MGGNDKKGMENQKVRSIAEQLSRVHRELTDATGNAEKAVRQLRWVWEGDDATTFFNAWPTTRHSLDLSTGGVDELAKKLREEIGEQELTSAVAGTGGDSDGDGIPDRDDQDDDNDGIPDENDPEHAADSPFDALEVNVGTTLAEGDKEFWDQQVAGHTWGDENGNHLTAEALSTDASGDYQLGINQDGLVAAGGVTAGAYLAKVNGAYSNSYGTAAEGKAYVGAEANADAGVTLGANGVKAEAGGDVFAGGKAEGSVSQDLGPVDVGVGGEISYGIGAHAHADAEISSDNIGVSVDIGATLGIGGGIKLDIGFDPPW